MNSETSIIDSSISEQLQQGLRELNIQPSQENIDKLLDYVALLIKWNKTYNLTAISVPEDIISHHILDSLAILPYIKGDNVLDVGSGAGFPGIPLALFLPQHKFVLLDSNGKKTRFMSHVVMNLALPNVKVEQARIEKFNFTTCFDTIVARAFSTLKDIIGKSQHLYCEDGQLLAMKGKYPQEELAELETSLIVSVHRLQVPQLDAERHLVHVLGIK